MKPERFKEVEKEGKQERRGFPCRAVCDWLCAPVLLGGRGWLNKQS